MLDIAIDCQTLDFLLKPLKLKVDMAAKAKHDKIFIVPLDGFAKTLSAKHCAKSFYVLFRVLYDDNCGAVRCSFQNASKAMYALKMTKSFLVKGYSTVDGKISPITTIDNPYFGSRSLEEMMIKRDLIADERQ